MNNNIYVNELLNSKFELKNVFIPIKKTENSIKNKITKTKNYTKNKRNIHKSFDLRTNKKNYIKKNNKSLNISNNNITTNYNLNLNNHIKAKKINININKKITILNINNINKIIKKPPQFFSKINYKNKPLLKKKQKTKSNKRIMDFIHNLFSNNKYNNNLSKLNKINNNIIN